MKVVLVMVVCSLAWGCGKGKQTVNQSPKAIPPNNSTANLVDDRKLELQVIGAYEWDDGKMSQRWVILKNGEAEIYENGEKSGGHNGAKWEIVAGEIHVTVGDGDKAIVEIDKDGGLAVIAEISNGNIRTEVTIENQLTLNRVK